MSKNRLPTVHDDEVDQRRQLTPYEKEIASRIKDCRQQAGISQERAASLVAHYAGRSVSRSLWERWENGAATMDAWLLPSIAKALKTTTTYLLGEDNTSPRLVSQITSMLIHEPEEDHDLYLSEVARLRENIRRIRNKGVLVSVE